MKGIFENMRNAQVESMLFVGNCALAMEFVPAETEQLTQGRLKTVGKIIGFDYDVKPKYRRFGKYKVKETFAGEESLTSLLTQYVERTVAIRY